MAPRKPSSKPSSSTKSSSKPLTKRQQALKVKRTITLAPSTSSLSLPSSSSPSPLATSPPPKKSKKPHTRTLQVVTDTFGFPSGSQKAKNLHTLSKRLICPTLFFHEPTCALLAIQLDVYHFMEHLGLRDFLAHSPLTYACLTLEFLSSLQRNSLVKGQPLTYSFQLGGVWRTMTLSEFNQVLGFPEGGDVTPGLRGWPGFDPDKLWKMITGDPIFTPKAVGSTDRSIINPALRYCHRLLVNLFFSKKDSNKVRLESLQLIWMMLQDSKDIGRLNHSRFLLEDLFRVQSQDSGEIHCGGIVTLLAQHFAIDLTGHHPVSLNHSLDMTGLVRSGFVSRVPSRNDIFLWRVKGEPYIYLPSRATDFISESALSFSKDLTIPDRQSILAYLNDYVASAVSVSRSTGADACAGTSTALMIIDETSPRPTLDSVAAQIASLSVSFMDFASEVRDRLTKLETRVSDLESSLHTGDLDAESPCSPVASPLTS